MHMPITYYEILKDKNKELFELVSLAKKTIVKNNEVVQPVHSADKPLKEFLNYEEKELYSFLKVVSQNSGIPIESMINEIRTNSDTQNILNIIIENATLEFFSVLNFELFGKKTFFFRDNLIDNLLNTEINLPAKEIHLPFDSCQLVFTNRNLIDAFYSLHKKNENEELNIDYKSPIYVFVTIYQKTRNDVLNRCGRELELTCLHGNYSQVYMVQKRRLFLDDTWELEETLKTDWEYLASKKLDRGLVANINQLDNISPAVDSIFYEDGLIFFRAVLNSVLYISSENPDSVTVNKSSITQKTKKKKIKNQTLEQKRNNSSELSYQDVGSSIQPIIIDKSMQDKFSNFNSSTQKKILRRFMVRGHWRKQRVGEGLKDFKRIWIKPYLKGQDFAEAINKPYLV